MTTNSPNPVDGDVQALIAHIKEVLQEYDEHGGIGYGESVYRTALAALTAKPYAYASRNTDMSKESQYFSASVFNNAWGDEYTVPLYTTQPAQLLRPVELPEPYDDGHGNLWLPQDAVISAVKNAGGEVKS